MEGIAAFSRERVETIYSGCQPIKVLLYTLIRHVKAPVRKKKTIVKRPCFRGAFVTQYTMHIRIFKDRK
mgnify:CR=1 FL=1